MICASPIWIQSKNKVTGNWVPCNKCYACLANRRNVWTFRLLQELRVSESGYFVTLTYDDDNVPKVPLWDRFQLNTLQKKDVQKFNKRIRNAIMQNEDPNGRWMKESPVTGNYSPKYRFFAAGEYGKLGNRPHYHILMYNLPHDYIDNDPIFNKKWSKYLEEIWEKGRVDVGMIEQRSAHYVAKYTLDSMLYGWEEEDVRQKPFAIMSRKPGLGVDYVTNTNRNYHYRSKNSFATIKDNIQQPLGRYLKEKIFTDDEARIQVQRRAERFVRAKERHERKQIGGTESDFQLFKRNQYDEACRKIKRSLKQNKL